MAPSHLPTGARFPENSGSPGVALPLTVSQAAFAGRKTWQPTDMSPAMHVALTLRCFFFKSAYFFNYKNDALL